MRSVRLGWTPDIHKRRLIEIKVNLVKARDLSVSERTKLNESINRELQHLLHCLCKSCPSPDVTFTPSASVEATTEPHELGHSKDD